MNVDHNIYNKCFVLEKGVKVIYVEIQEALYGLLHSSLLFCLKLATDLKNNGFIINPFGPFMGKKLLKGGFITVV